MAKLIRHDAGSALVIDAALGRGVLVQESSPRNFTTLLVEWQGHGGCVGRQRRIEARQVGRLFDTFQVVRRKDLSG
jgi:hypothetical protein